MSSVQFRPADAALLPAIVALDQLCLGGLWTLEGYQRELDSPNSDLIAIVPNCADPHDNFQTLTTAGDLKRWPTQSLELPPSLPVPAVLGYGCAWAILDEAHITIVAVHPDYRRYGLGRLLLKTLLYQAQQRGMARATLEVRPSNQPALNLYEQLGFTVAGRRKHYYPDTQEDALILWRGGLRSADFTTPELESASTERTDP